MKMVHDMEHTAHTVKSYDEELAMLVNTIAHMGMLAEEQLANAVQAVVRRDSALANQVVADDSRVDELEQEVHKRVVRMLALRQPVAIDLRNIVISLKISSDLERIADYAANLTLNAIATGP
ncbi:MAG: phosphate transport system protein [Rhodospirillaceae bacterium]|nr:MAG: phosphate transport system protein [Rhodospirillaceae bacterium]